MKILMKQDEITKVSQLWHLKQLFEQLFANYDDYDLFCSITSSYLSYLLNLGTKQEQDYLENFVEEYFVMRGLIVDNRNAMIEYLQSEEF